MSDTIPDIVISKELFSDTNTLTGISVGTALVISNKSTSRILLQLALTQPVASSDDGEILAIAPNATSVKIITAGESTLWAKSLGHSSGKISVQDNS